MARGAILFGTLEELYLKLASFVDQNFAKFRTANLKCRSPLSGIRIGFLWVREVSYLGQYVKLLVL